MFSKLNYETRIDAEYFKSSYLFLKENLKKHNCLSIGEFSYVTDGIHTSIDYCENSKVNLMSATSPKENFFDLSRQVFISEDAHAKNPRTALKKGDVIVSTIGTIGNCAVVDETVLPANSDRHIGIIRIEKDFSPYFISTFLLSKYGKFQTLRESTGNVQLALFLYKIRELVIPCFSHDFQIQIEELVKNAHVKLVQAKTIYTQAETMLLEALGMADFTPSTEVINIKSFKDSFNATGRLDAEYYQPKYEDYQAHVQSYPYGWMPLMRACGMKEDNFTPDIATEYKYIELADIDNAGGITGCTEATGCDLPSRARRKVAAGDVLVSSVEGSLSSCAIVPSVMDGALCSTGFYVVRSDKINAETLLVLFKSPLIQNLLKQGCSGTILTAINKTEFQNIPIPIIETGAQSKIATLIKESFTLKAESENLLESAKRAVEIAIEQSEDAALDYLALAQKE